MKNIISLALSLLFSFFAAAQAPKDYYTPAEGKTGEVLKTALHNIIKGHVAYSYDDIKDHMRYVDEDPDNTNNVILLYTGWSYPKTNFGGNVSNWNREHTWAKSQGNFGESKGPGTDLHHIRPTDTSVNSARGNLMFDNGGSPYTDSSRYGGGSGVTGCFKGSNNWEANDLVKGDVARMLFYMAVRYEGTSDNDRVNLELAENSSTSGLHGKKSTLIQWDKFDPVSDWERRRNNRIYELQENRNPFIDFPELADYIWGDKVGTPWYSSSSGTGTDDPGCDDLYFSAPFDEMMAPFTAFSVSGSQEWEWRDAEYGVAISAFENNTNHTNEDWLLSPVLNLTNYSDIKLEFEHTINKGLVSKMETENTLWISNNYTGGNPNNATWTQLSIPVYPAGNNWVFVNSGPIEIPDDFATENSYIGFRYISTTSASSMWEVRNFSIAGSCIPVSSVKEQTPIKLSYPISVDNYGKVTVFKLNGEHIALFDIYGKLIFNSIAISDTMSIPTHNPGIYILKIGDVMQKIIIK